MSALFLRKRGGLVYGLKQSVIGILGIEEFDHASFGETGNAAW